MSDTKDPDGAPPTERETLSEMARALVVFRDGRRRGATLDQVAQAVTDCARIMRGVDRRVLGQSTIDVMLRTEPEAGPS